MPQHSNINIGILVPTYNNLKTLIKLVQDLLAMQVAIIIVNDGSNDGTKQYLEQINLTNQVVVLHHEVNKGKGKALLTGFQYMLESGFTHAITMDSDGQHSVKDLLSFIDNIEKAPNSIWLGARNLNQEHVPQKSSLGNRFSNFWVWVQTGLQLPDTQTGFRAYPLSKILNKQYYSSKFEFEIEVIVRNQWSGTDIKSLPINVFYPPSHERVSHFRPAKDFFRISVLNTVLTLLALFWYIPLRFIQSLFRFNTWKKLYQNTFFHPNDSYLKQKLSVSFGVFMGIVPIWGFQLLVGIPLAILFKLNKGLFLIGANISIFPLTPIWWLLSLKTGQWILGLPSFPIVWKNWDLEAFKNMGASFFIGGFVLAVILSLLTFFILSLKPFINLRSDK